MSKAERKLFKRICNRLSTEALRERHARLNADLQNGYEYLNVEPGELNGIMDRISTVWSELQRRGEV